MITIIVLIVAVVLIGALVAVYNGLIKSRVRVDEAWSDINVQLKRRYDLIPNLVNTVKGYATHESKVFTDVTEARTSAMNATGIAQKAETENMLAGALKSLFAVSEAYPELKANEGFQQLRRMRYRAQAAADVHIEAAHQLAVHVLDSRQHPQVVDVD